MAFVNMHSHYDLPGIYAAANEQYNPDYPLFKFAVADFCDEITDIATQTIAYSKRRITINDLLPKIKFRIFGIFANTTVNGEKGSRDEMDGPTRAFSVVIGGLVAGIASFVFGSFYSNYQEANRRLERCEEFKESLPEVWQIRNHCHSLDMRFIVAAEEKLARAEKRSAMINMALTVGIIAAGAILIVAGLFGSVGVALAAVVLAVSVGVVAMAKFGMNFFDKEPARKASLILDRIDQLKSAREIQWA